MEAGPGCVCIDRAKDLEGARVRRRKRRDIDWSAIEHDYRAGPLSLRQLALKHGCSHSTIANFAGKHGWIRMRVEPVHSPIGRPRQPAATIG